MSKRRHQLSDLKPASIPFIAEETYQTLKYAPGNKTPLPPPVRKPARNMKLEAADADITRCRYCGSWATDYTCSHCKEHGWPSIDDLGETA